jgi:hypothetical protein
MGASEFKELPGDLVQGRKRFQAWRERQQGRRRIPPALWALAVRLARTHGVSRTATALRLDYYCLKKQVEAVAGQAPSNKAVFVELPAAVVAGKQCLLELDNGAGTTLRVQLVGYDPAEVRTLACSIWSGR